MRTPVRLPLQYDSRKASDESATFTPGPSRTLQAPAQETNINVIMAKFLKTGVAPGAKNLPKFQDFEDVFDFQTAQGAIIKAKNMFMSLPAKIREKFQNNPQELMEAMADPERKEELTKLGLIEKEKQPTLEPFEKMDKILEKHFPPKDEEKPK